MNEPRKANGYSNILAAIAGDLWPILPSKLEAILRIVELHAAGYRPPEGGLEAAAGRGRPKAIRGSIAVLPLYGVIAQRMNVMTDMSGGTSTELFGKDFTDAMNDDSVGAIVIDVDSPGGAISGVPELAGKIFEARGKKPVIAVANTLMASAAYWISSAADKVYAAPSAYVGSIGAVAVHTDVSAAEELAGVKTSLIYAGKKKVDANPYEPLNDGARADMQARVDDAYDMFIGDVAKARGVEKSAVRSGYGEGAVLTAKLAKAAGMVDGIATLDDVIGLLEARQTEESRKAKARRVVAAMGREAAILAATQKGA